MKIILTIPGFTPHGGIRVIMEWANWFVRAGHEVRLLCRRSKKQQNWFALDPKVKIERSEVCMRKADVLIICSPHDIRLVSSSLAPKRKFLFMQMLEHLFSPNNLRWNNLCQLFYSSWVPMFSISKWNIDYLVNKYPNRGDIYYIGNGVNLKDFSIEKPKNRDGRTVLIEGWNATNESKDVDHLGPQVALRLKSRGYRILAYSQLPLNNHRSVPDEFYRLPTLEKLNELYRRADILIKATRYDARSCAPMEAMTKGCVPVRAIVEGDDDLIDDFNCIRVPYDKDSLYTAALKVLKNTQLRMRLARRGHEYVQEYTWDYWMKKIEGVLTADANV